MAGTVHSLLSADDEDVYVTCSIEGGHEVYMPKESRNPDCSFTAIPNVALDLLSKLKPPLAAWAVLMNLYRRANVAKECWPATATIASDTGLARSSVCEGLRWLIANGFITSRGRRGATGVLSNIYTCVWNPGLPVSGQPGTPVSGQPDSNKNQLEQETKKNIVQPENTAHETAWTEFRSLYPKRLGSLNTPKGKQIYLRLLKEGTKPEVIEEALRKEIGAWRGGGTIGTAYIPQIPSWLNKQPWNDHSGVLHGPPTSDTGAQSKTPVRSSERPKEDWRG